MRIKPSIYAPYLSKGLPYAAAVMLMAASAPAQNLFVAGSGYTGNIYEIAPGGSPITYAQNQGGPSGVAFDSSGDLFVTDDSNGNIFKFMSGGVESTFASGLSQLDGGIAFNGAGNLFVENGGDILEYSPGGSLLTTFVTGLNSPGGIAFDRAGNLYVANSGSGTILKYTPGGSVSTFASGLDWPNALTFDASGNLYTAEFNNGNIDKFTSGGSESTFSSGWQYPQALAFNNAGSLYLFEGPYDGTSIVAFTPNGSSYSTIASGFAVPTTDGMAFQGLPLPVPEPPVCGLLAMGGLALFVTYRQKTGKPATVRR